MRHIKKKFLLETTTSDKLFDENKFTLINLKKDLNKIELKERKSTVGYIETEDNKLIGAFVQKIEGKNYLIPVPDPTLIYFNNAQLSLKMIKQNKKILLDKLDVSEELTETGLNEIYNFYGTTSGFVIFLFTSIESYINQLIPDDFIYEVKDDKRTVLYNKKQIQRNITFNTKLKVILNEATGKNYFKKQTPTTQHLDNLKKFRDDIIHTKQDENPVKYEKLLKTSLKFKYESTLKALANFMNFYNSNYIVECECGRDF